MLRGQNCINLGLGTLKNILVRVISNEWIYLLKCMGNKYVSQLSFE